MKKIIWLLAALLALPVIDHVQPVFAQAPDSKPGCTYNTVAPTLSDKQSVGIQCDTNGQLKISGSINATSAATATAAAPTYVEGTSDPLSQDLSGGLRVNCTTGCSGGTFNNNADAVATSATNGQAAAWLYGYNGTTWDRLRVDANKYLNADVQSIAGTAVATGNGVVSAGVQRVAIASDNTAFSVNATLAAETTKVIGTVRIASGGVASGSFASGSIASGAIVAGAIAAGATSLVKLEDVASASGDAGVPAMAIQQTTPADTAADGDYSMLQMKAGRLFTSSTIDAALPAGSNVIGHVIADTGSTTAVTQATATNLNAAVVGTGTAGSPAGNILTVQGVASMTPIITNPAPSATSGGTTLYTLTLAASTNATNVKASAGQLYSISGFNMSSATPVWISLYNNAGTPTCGTNIIQQFLIPGSTTGTGFVYDFAAPKAFATGIAFCATTGIAGTGNPAATTYVLNVDYK